MFRKPTSVLLSPLTPSVSLYLTLCSGPPHQSSRFLPSPSQLTSQQVERWSLRTLLWPGSLCPSICMTYSVQAPSARGQAPRLSWVGVSGYLELSSPFSAVPPCSCPFWLLLLRLLHCCGVCADTLVLKRLLPSFPCPFPSRQGVHVSPPIQALVVSRSHLAVMLPRYHLGRLGTCVAQDAERTLKLDRSCGQMATEALAVQLDLELWG